VAKVVVLGLGNLLLCDDGAGVVALHRLARAVQPDPRVAFIDGGTLGLALLDFIDPESELIIVDAVRADGPPGTVVVLEGADVAAAAEAKLSPHQVGVADLLCAADHLGRTPIRTVLVGVVPEAIELGTERTPAVEAAIQAMVTAVVAEVARAGVELRPLREGHVPHLLDLSPALGV
jgi:hydrogenase maturation protease